MTVHADILALEKQFWTGDAEFYRTHVDSKCLVAFPHMAAVMTNEDVARNVTKDGPQWRDVNFREKGLVEPTQGMAVFTYEASAKRGPTGELYSALVSSGYVKRDGAWKLAFHQQTPLTNARGKAN